ncbi:MAG: Hsp33 family molecular chaperone HslO [Burkholderiaceae bacterium]|nr:Hsp33 family molecular chaperone HslO [Burkholderiaceae bacterium]
MTDKLQKFLFEGAAVRGELVEISETWQQVQARHDYPKAVKALLGEMLSAAALLSANLKFDGATVLQIHGDGPVRLLVVECDSALRMRATAKLAPDVQIDDSTTLQQLVHAHGNGRFVITLDPREKLPGQQPYQGVVPLDGDNIATVIENYMMRSEQLDTRIWLAADDHVSRGMLLQKLPVEGGVEGYGNDDHLEPETWNHLVTLASTLETEEMLNTDIDTLLRRLFWEETIRIFEPARPHFDCTCSREKVGDMLRMLGQAEVDAALAEQGRLDIRCDFCGQSYAFDSVDCAQLFVADTLSDSILPSSDSIH